MPTFLPILVLSAGLAQQPQQPLPNTANDQIHQPAAEAANGSVQQVEESIPFGTVAGKLVANGSYLIFIDDEQPQNSFVLERSNVQNATYSNGMVHLTLKKPVRDRSGPQPSMSFRFLNPEGTQMVVGWMKTAVTAAEQPPNPPATAPDGSAPADLGPTMVFGVRHEKPAGGDNGRLILAPGGIHYESASDLNASRRWSMSDIREVKLEDPHRLKLVPLRGEAYEFELDGGRGITAEQYQMLLERVRLAQAQRPAAR